MAGDTLDVLLVEDNPGDARLVEEMLAEAAPRLHRIELDGECPDRSAVRHASELAAGLELLSGADPDVILLDLGLPDSTGLDTVDSVVDATEFTPVVVLTGLDDREIGVRAIQHGAHDFLVKDEVGAVSLVRSMQYAIEQARQKRERIRHREQLEALNRLNRISQDVTHAVITSATRDDLERAVCERLVGPEAYGFAWFGDVNGPTDRFESRTAVAVDCGFDVTTVPVAADGATDERPEARAVRTREVQVVQDIPAEPAFDTCRDQMEACGFRSMAAIPVTYRSVFYGILAIYDASPDAFDHTELENLSRWGDVVGHAITALERRKALVSDAALQLAFRLDGTTEDLVAHSTEGWALDIERLVRRDDGLLVYGRAEDVPEPTLREEVDSSSLFGDLRTFSADGDGYEVELVTNWGVDLVSDLAKRGGHVSSVTIADGEFRFVLEAPRGQDKHQLVELVQDRFPGASLQAQRTIDRDDPNAVDSREAFADRLTDKQRAALETAYHAGYFDWPRTTSGQEIADRLGITQATFSQHFRAAERAVFDGVFETEADDDADVSSPWNAVEPDAKPT